MAQRDRAAQRVDLATVQPQIADDRQALRGEGFVQFDPVEMVLLQAGLLQHLRDRLDRADAHDFGRHAGDREADEARQRRQIEAFQRGFARQRSRRPRHRTSASCCPR